MAEKSKIAKKEEEILKFWQKNKIFEKSLKKEAPKGDFVFYEGPPTANGKPGIHHLEARAFKDVIPRYKTMQGYHVRRKGGWDTHGLPVELEVEKELGLKSKKEIEEYGIAKFNQKCKESVWKYVDLWEKFTDRLGFWLDQENPYITYENCYIEAVWNIFKEIEKKKLLYKDYKVVPWCPRCGTGLSSHELAQGYEDVKDLSVTVKFKLKPGQKIKDWTTNDKTYILAWTTTPWTLPGNVALAVGGKIKYKIREADDEKLIEADENGDLTGKDLVNLEYEPLFSYFKDNISEPEKEKIEKAFKIYLADFVTTEEGTGIVHTAVMYGQDDFELGNEVGLPKWHTVDERGNFLENMGFLSGRFVKEEDNKGKPTLDIDIIEDLKNRRLLFSSELYIHSYPFCWRCHTPIIYYARDSWYVRMSDLRNKLVKENEGINWIPAHIKEGRFGEWLREVKDWAISRERYWGTPLPIWQNEKEENYVIGSVDELKKYTKKSGNKYFVMRHGEAEENLKNLVNSKIENVFHLTEKGKKQAATAVKDAKKARIDLIISSSFQRCKETAEIIAKGLSINGKEIIFDEKLREFEAGEEYEGKTWGEYLKFFKSEKERIHKAPKGGETLLDAYKRTGKFLYDLEKKYKDKNILVVCHNHIVNNMRVVVSGENFEEAVKAEKLHGGLEYAVPEEFPFTPLPHNENYELDLHKPYIDEIELVDEKGRKIRRISEVADVWFDSGGMPFAQDGLAGIKKIKYPADFISEAIDQTRGWFYTLHAIGVLMGKGKAFKNVICLGHILDSKGLKMSKHIGNVVDPWLMMNKYGVDALRMWMYTVNQPGDAKNFDEKTVDEVVKKIFNLTSNVVSFYDLYKDERIEPSDKSGNVLDKWIISRLHQLIGEGTLMINDFRIFEAARPIRDFVNDLSTWYIRRSRDRFKSEDLEDKNDTLGTTRFVLLKLAKYMAPFTPFFAEGLYENIRGKEDPESVHLCKWPKAEKVDWSVIQDMKKTREVVSLALEKRMAAEIKIRQPLEELQISNSKFQKLGEEYIELIKDEVNVKRVVFSDIEGEVKLDTEITEELKKEGNIREFIRAIQALRKDKKLRPSDSIELVIETNEKGKEFVNSVSKEVEKPTNVSNIKFEPNDGSELEIEDWKLKIQIK